MRLTLKKMDINTMPGGEIVKETLFNEESLSIAKDVLENQVGVEILEKIPLISYAVSFLKIANTARDQWLLRKMATFISEANLGRVAAEERAKVLKHFQQDEKMQKEELSFLILILDRYLEEDKAAWLAHVYVEFVKGNIDLSQLKIFAEMINRFLPGDYEALANGESEYKSYKEIPEAVLRLSSLGLMQRISRIITDASGGEYAQLQSGIAILPYENGGVFKYTSLGLKLKSILFPKIPLHEGLIELDYSQAISML